MEISQTEEAKWLKEDSQGRGILGFDGDSVGVLKHELQLILLLIEDRAYIMQIILSVYQSASAL